VALLFLLLLLFVLHSIIVAPPPDGNAWGAGFMIIAGLKPAYVGCNRMPFG
jgi:hypothetical protein